MKFNYYALKLCLICLIVFLMQIFIRSFTDLFVLNNLAFTQIWRFVTAIFLHGGIGHILYNLFALALFGSVLEKLIGGKKFLKVFFISGILANVVSVFFYDSSLGASGAIFGVIGALVIVRPLMVVFSFGLPMPMFIAGILWVMGDIIGIFIPSNVANIAHLAGIFSGFIFGALYRDKSKHYKKERNQAVLLDEKIIRKWEDNYMK